MKSLEPFLLFFYGASMLFIFCYSIVQLHLVYLYIRDKKRKKRGADPQPLSMEHLPVVTIQLPIYNELYVVERLIDTVISFDYPKEKLEIQVLDDSTDETIDIIRQKVQQYQEAGFRIDHIRRPNRNGYKAGALQYGLDRSTGEFIAIFDADFIPDKDFLLQTLPHFEDPGIGAVQTRWGHINRNYSLLTKLQAFGLDAHFSLEQRGRNVGGHFINFNGTAGIWRRKCIDDAGGWEADTLTEDLDLSYRAQVKGWQFKYLEEVESPAELPAAINALKTQQFRWTKGAAETAKKNLLTVLRSGFPLSTKIHATFHLLNSTIFLCIMITAILSVPLLYVKHQSQEYSTLIKIASVFLLSLLILAFFYWVSLYQQKKKFWATTWEFIPTFPLFLSFSMGLSLHNAIAVLEGYLGYKTPFIRTPKFNIKTAADQWTQNKYISRKFTPLALIEGIFALYFLYGIYVGFQLQDFGLFPFHIMLFLGFGCIFFYSVRHSGKI